MYFKVEEKWQELGKIENIKVAEVETESIKDREYTCELSEGSYKRIMRKLTGRITQKRFRKMLYSIGYGKAAVNNIIEIEWKTKGYYLMRDVEEWKKKKENSNI